MPSTSLPPDDGENNNASALPTGLRLGDAERIAAQRLDGSAEGSPASTTPLPLHDGDSNDVSILPTGFRLSDAEQVAAQRLDGAADGESNHPSELPANLRLSDAEQIATHRLDGAADGSLKEALAIAPAEDVANETPALGNAIEAVSEGFAAAPQAPPVDAMLAAGSSHTQPTAQHAPGPSTALPIEARAETEAVDAAGQETPEAPADGWPMLEPTRDLQASSSAAPQIAAAAPSLGVAAPETVRPLASALDAATKLAADANAAAEALESLKRLLERQLPNVAHGPQPPAPPAESEVWRTAVAEPSRPPPSPPHADADAGNPLQPAPRLPVPVQVRRMPVERTRLDVRGFLAGFALSWAFGIVLYLFMSAG